MRAEVEETAFIDWMYPDIYDDKPRSFLQIHLVHTRASDGIRIEYDSHRDGWVILQEDNHDEWKEVAFAQSWALKSDEHRKSI